MPEEALSEEERRMHDDLKDLPEIEDSKRTLLHKYWLERPAQGAGCVVHDVHRETD